MSKKIIISKNNNEKTYETDNREFESVCYSIEGSRCGEKEGVEYSGTIYIETVDGRTISIEIDEELLFCDDFDKVNTVQDLYKEFTRLFNVLYDVEMFENMCQFESLSEIKSICLMSQEDTEDEWSEGERFYDFVNRKYRTFSDGTRY